jgi:hypothetical protein
LTGLVDELIEAAEENRVAGYLARCAEAGLTPKLTREIELDARFPKVAKALLKNAIPRLAAKWLNKTGISAEYQDEISVLTALILIVKHGAQTNSRLEELIEEVKKQRSAPPLAPQAVKIPVPAPAPKPTTSVPTIKVPAGPEQTIVAKIPGGP